MNRIVKIVLAANLAAFAILAFVYPHLMVAPGKLIPGHGKLEADCFACHAPFSGADSQRCITCHKPEEIGRLTTAGLPIAKPLTSTPFHQKLTRQDCVACHSDHAGVKRFRPTGHFDHLLLEKVTRAQCKGCHESPKDSLHRQLTAECSQCHSQKKWTPATFDHFKSFELDRDHNVRCVTCHVRDDYSRYTCYGCHEHTPDKIRRKHIKEGIRDYDNCVECHRNANEDDIRGEFARRGGDGRGKRDRHGDGD